jgi:hypothetical protein
MIENSNDPTAEIKYRLITSLLAPQKFRAKLLPAEYHQRWEVENTIDEFKVHLGERKTHVRSQRPREVVQEIHGLLLGHWAVRSLICQTAHSAEISPLSIYFTGTLRVIRRAVPKIQRLEPQEIPFFLTWLNLEILDATLPQRVQRNNPKVVKKPVAKFKSKKVKHRGTGININPPVFNILKPPKP